MKEKNIDEIVEQRLKQERQKTNKKIIIVVGLVILLIALCVGGYFIYQNIQEEKAKQEAIKVYDELMTSSFVASTEYGNKLIERYDNAASNPLSVNDKLTIQMQMYNEDILKEAGKYRNVYDTQPGNQYEKGYALDKDKAYLNATQEYCKANTDTYKCVKSKMEAPDFIEVVYVDQDLLNQCKQNIETAKQNFESARENYINQ